MMILSRRFPDCFTFILYCSSHTITFVLPALDSEPISQWYSMFVSCAARVGLLMYNSSNLSTSSRSNYPWFVRRFVYFVGVIGSSGICIIPTASSFHLNSVARPWVSWGTGAGLRERNGRGHRSTLKFILCVVLRYPISQNWSRLVRRVLDSTQTESEEELLVG